MPSKTGSSSQAKRAVRPNPQRAALPQSSPSWDDAEEALEAGVEAEERGERTAYGFKAQRCYEEALTCYQAAISLSEGSDSAHLGDAAYNAARILYLLSTEFYMPATALQALNASVDLYKTAARAVALPQSPEAPLSDFALDIASNLCAAQQAIAELVDTTPTAAGIDDAAATALVSQLVGEASEVLERIARDQESVLSSQLQDEVASQSLSETGEAAASALVGGPPSQPEREADPSEGSSTTAYSSSLIVPTSLLETWLTHHDMLTTLLAQSKSVEETQQIDSVLNIIMGNAKNFVAACNSAHNWGERASPDGDWDDALSTLERAANESQVMVFSNYIGATSAIADVAVQTRAADIAQDQTAKLRSTLEAKNSWDSQASALPGSRRQRFWQLKADELIALADQSVTVARLLTRLAMSQGPTHLTSVPIQGLLRSSWTLASLASQAYLAALNLLETGSSGGRAAVLGSASIVNPTKLQRCSVFTSLSSLCLLRAHPSYGLLTTPAVVTDSSRSTILDNARVYARRALGEVGLTWVLEQPAGADVLQNSNTTAVKRLLTEKAKDVPPRGWGSIEIQSEALLQGVRAIFHRGTFRPSPPSSNEVSGELQQLASLMGGLCRGGPLADETMVSQGWCLALDIQRWYTELVDEEGDGSDADAARHLASLILPEETQFWNRWAVTIAG
ncbi:unnamed protein product [Parajaminaea phylloscopi]